MFKRVVSISRGRVSPIRLVGLNRSANMIRYLRTNGPKAYNFEDIKQLVQHPDPKKVLVDVREPEELKECKLPNSINIPLKSAPGALGLPEEEFQELFHIEKPPKDKELIFFCALGVRAKTSEELARSYGYESTGVWEGSMKEWKEKGGDKIKV